MQASEVLRRLRFSGADWSRLWPVCANAGGSGFSQDSGGGQPETVTPAAVEALVDPLVRKQLERRRANPRTGTILECSHAGSYDWDSESVRPTASVTRRSSS